MKKQIIIYALLILCINCNAQFNHFLIGFYSYDYDNNYSDYAAHDPYTGNDINLYKDLKNLNFNFILIDRQLFRTRYEEELQKTVPDPILVSELPSKAFLDRASQVDIKIILTSSNNWVDKYNSNINFNQTQSIEGLEYFANHNSIIGYHIIDEPAPRLFPFIKNHADEIMNYNSSVLRLANLFPAWGSKLQICGIPNDAMCSLEEYAKYVTDYIELTNPNILSFDYYPIWNHTLSERFFYNLDLFGKISVERNIPFIYVGTSIKKLVFTTCNLNEFNFWINSALMYGAKGIAYWHNNMNNDFWGGVIPQDILNSLSNYHLKLKEAEDILLKLKFLNAYHYSNYNSINDTIPYYIPSQSTWSYIHSDNLIIKYFDYINPISVPNGYDMKNIMISFFNDDNGNEYLGVFNKSIIPNDNILLKLNFKENTSLYNIIDKQLYEPELSSTIELDAGEAKIFQLIQTYNYNFSECNHIFLPYLYKTIFSENTTLGGENCILRYLSGSQIDYYSNNIKLLNGVTFENGCNVNLNSINLGNSNAYKVYHENKDSLFKVPSDDVFIFPNPSNGNFNISVNSNNKLLKIELFTLGGVKVYEQNILNILRNDSDVINIKSNNLKSGFYAIKLIYLNEIKYKSIIIN